MCEDQSPSTEELFSEVADLPTLERVARLDRICVDQPSLRVRLEELVEAYKRLAEDEHEHSERYEAGSQLGRYELVKRLGQGGFGEVWHARDSKLGRSLALKLLFLANEQQYQAALEEAQVLARIHSDYVVKVHEMGRIGENGPVFIDMDLNAMQDVESADSLIIAEPLAVKAVGAGGEPGLSQERTCQIVGDVCKGIAAAHSLGIVHRDIKPGNVLLLESGRAVVIDFGIARLFGDKNLTGVLDKALDAQDSLSIRSERGAVCGTPRFMAPEVAQGQQATPVSDIYSVGAMLYYLLSAQYPYAPRDGRLLFPEYDVLEQLREGLSPRPLEELLPKCSPVLSAICQKAMNKTASLRYQNLLELQQDLGRYLRNELTSVEDPTLIRRSSLFYIRNRVLLNVLMVAGVLALGLSSLWIQSEMEAREKQRIIQLQQRVRNLFDEAESMSKRKLSAQLIQSKIDEALSLKQAEYSDYLRAFEIYESVQAWEEAARVLELAIPLKDLPSEALYNQHILLLRTKHAGEEVMTPPLKTLIIESQKRGEENEFTLLAKASQYQIKGEVQSALDYYARAEELSRKIPRLYNNRGVIYSQRKEFAKAESDFSRAIELDRTFHNAYSGRSGVYAKQSKYKKAKADALVALDLYEKDVLALINLGIAWQNLKNFAGAKASFDKALKFEPNQIKALYNRGALFLALKNYRSAIADFSAVLKQNSVHLFALNNRALCLLELGRTKEALLDLNKAIELNDKFSKAYSNRGLAFTKLNRLTEAEADFRKTFELDPKDFRSRVNLANILNGRGQGEEALSILKAAVKIESGNSDIYNSMGAVLFGLGKREQAKLSFVKALELDPNKAEAAKNLGFVCWHLKLYDEALEAYTKAIKIDSKDYLSYFNRGSLRSMKGFYSLAVLDFNEVLKLKPDYYQAYVSRGFARFQLGEKTGAIEDYKKSLSIHESYYEAYYQLAEAYRALEKWALAYDNYKKCLVLQPNHSRSKQIRALLEEMKGKLSSLLKAEKSGSQEIKDHVAWYNEGVVKRRLGRLKEAVAAYSMCLKMNGNYARAYYNRGCTYQDLKQYEAAIADMKAFLKLQPQHPAAKSARQIIESLEKSLKEEEGGGR